MLSTELFIQVCNSNELNLSEDENGPKNHTGSSIYRTIWPTVKLTPCRKAEESSL
jgi:hypothetical protein